MTCMVVQPYPQPLEPIKVPQLIGHAPSETGLQQGPQASQLSHSQLRRAYCNAGNGVVDKNVLISAQFHGPAMPEGVWDGAVTYRL